MNENVVQAWLYDKSPSTQANYRRMVSKLPHKRIEDITLADLQTAVNSTPPRSRSLATATYKSLFHFALDEGYIKSSPAANLKSKKQVQRLADRILSEETVLDMIAQEDDIRNHAILRLLYHSGLRVSELANLKWSDINEQQDNDGMFAVLTIVGKGEKLRHVRISEDVYCMLVEQAEDELFVFKSRKGSKLTIRQINRIVKEAGERVGHPNISPHWLRHCNASHSLNNGAPINLVQQSLGHSSLLITERYLHVRPNAGSSQFLKA
jgi:integrase/recombinase XerD